MSACRADLSQHACARTICKSNCKFAGFSTQFASTLTTKVHASQAVHVFGCFFHLRPTACTPIFHWKLSRMVDMYQSACISWMVLTPHSRIQEGCCRLLASLRESHMSCWRSGTGTAQQPSISCPQPRSLHRGLCLTPGDCHLLQVYQDLFVDQDSARTEHIFERLADPSGSIDIVGWSQGIRLQACSLQGSLGCFCICNQSEIMLPGLESNRCSLVIKQLHLITWLESWSAAAAAAAAGFFDTCQGRPYAGDHLEQEDMASQCLCHLSQLEFKMSLAL